MADGLWHVICSSFNISEAKHVTHLPTDNTIALKVRIEKPQRKYIAISFQSQISSRTLFLGQSSRRGMNHSFINFFLVKLAFNEDRSTKRQHT